MENDPRLTVLSLLDDHNAIDQKEKDDIALIRSLINQHTNILSRDCSHGHVTGSALVIDRMTGRILMHYHRSLDRWLQLGGHMDKGELDPSQTALREAHEESGLSQLRFLPEAERPRPIDIDVHTIPTTAYVPEHLHLDFRYVLLTLNSTLGFVDDNESKQFQWLTQPELQRQHHMIDSSLMRLARKTFTLYTHYVSSD